MHEMSENLSETGAEGLNSADWFGGAESVLFMHAHPDDETIGTGGTIAGLVSMGRKPSVLTFTRGEQGETTESVSKRIAEGAGLVDLRVAELQSALEILGVEEHAFLGTHPARAIGDTAIGDTVIYEDSGMEWGADGFARASSTVGDAAATKHPAVNVINDAIAYAVHVEAEAIVSYDALGGYGHPDHILAHRVARAVAYGLEIPFYSIETKFEESIEPAGLPIDEDGVEDRSTPLITIDVTPWMSQKIEALSKFESQVTVIGDDELEHVGGQRHKIATSEAYLLHGALQISSMHEE